MVMINSNFEKSFRIKHEDNKFFSKLLSKENSKATSSIPSFRVYYNDVPSSVPFIWELQPGTPKHEFSQASLLLPPLTPPPSYYSNTNINSHKKPIKKNSRSKLFNALIMKFSPKKSSLPSSPSSSSSSSSSSTLSWSSSNTLHSSFSAPTTPSHLNYHEDILPASKLCLVKKALFSIVGVRGSN